MRIKIVKCSGDYWYKDEIGKEYDVIRQVEFEDFEKYKYKLTEDVDQIGDYVVEQDPEEGTMLTVDQYDVEEAISIKPTNNIIDHPNYYNKGKIEVIDFIEDQELGFNLGNAVKYISRAGKKNVETYIQDLKKAIWYLEREANK
jgi:hypothetical protein